MKHSILFILYILLSFSSLYAQDETYFIKIEGIDTLDEESITSILPLDDKHILLTSTGAQETSKPWYMINRKFNLACFKSC